MSERILADLTDLAGSPLIDRLAVLACFDPDAVDDPDSLRPLCVELVPRAGHREWMLRDSVRAVALGRMISRGGLRELRATRERTTLTFEPTVLQQVLDAVIRGEAPDPERLEDEALRALLRVQTWMADAANRSDAPSTFGTDAQDRDRIEARLALLETLRPLREATADGCIGRDDERAQLRGFALEEVPASGTFGVPLLQVVGVGGMGKSTLVAQCVLDLAELPDGLRPAWAYLDLDRPTLSSYEPEALLRDVMSQVAAQYPGARRYLEGAIRELTFASSGDGIESDSVEAWRFYTKDLGAALSDVAGGRLVVVVDTFEEAQRVLPNEAWTGRGAERLIDMFRELSFAGPQLRLIISGRAPLDDLGVSGPDAVLAVRELRGAAARELLVHFYRRELASASGTADPSGDLPSGLADSVIESVGGSPLTLKLAARVLAAEGPEGVAGFEQSLRTLDLVRRRFVRGFLYHRILDHIGGVDRDPDSPLPLIAKAALGLRTVTPQLLDLVVLPALGRTDLDAYRWFEELRRERALAYRPLEVLSDPTRALRIREDLRGPAVRALRIDDADLLQRVHEQAIAFYSHHRELPEAETELAYHLLASDQTHHRFTAHALAPEVVMHAADAADLPGDVRSMAGSAGKVEELFARQREERSTTGQVERLLADGDLDSARHMIAIVADRPPTTTLWRLASTVEERAGDLAAATDAARRELDAAEAAEDAERFAVAAVRAALLLERSAAGPAGVETLRSATGHALVAGRPSLRLQMHLNAMALEERIGVDGAIAVWDLRQGRLVGELAGPTAEPVAITVARSTGQSADTTIVVVGRRTGQIGVWRLDGMQPDPLTPSAAFDTTHSLAVLDLDGTQVVLASQALVAAAICSEIEPGGGGADTGQDIRAMATTTLSGLATAVIARPGSLDVDGLGTDHRILHLSDTSYEQLATGTIADRSYVVAATADGVIDAWDLVDGPIGPLGPVSGRVHGLAVVRLSGLPCAVAATSDGQIRIWNLPSRELLETVESPPDRALVLVRGDDSRPDAVQPLRLRNGRDGRWLAELDAAAMITESTPETLADGAVLRLLAATLGRDEPSWLRAAVTQVGLGATPNSSHLVALADQLAAWDAARAEPGSLARAVGLYAPPDDQIAASGEWLSRIFGLHGGGGTTLDQVWSIAEPPIAVREAIRQIYLWWRVDANPTFEDELQPTVSAVPERHFLDRVPLDFADPALQELLRVLGRAYPRSGDLEGLAARSGVNPANLSFQQPVALLLRDLVAEAAVEVRLPDVIREILADPAIRYLQPQLRDLIGPDWLTGHGID